MAEDETRPEIEIFDLPNLLREKVGPGDGTFDLEAIARAEAALGALQGEWRSWLDEDVAALLAAHECLHHEGFSDEVSEDLHRTAHDLKGLAPTYQYPLVGQIAASLCRVLTRVGDGGGDLPVDVVDAHVDAIRASIHEDIRDLEHPQGAALLAALDDLIRKRMG